MRPRHVALLFLAIGVIIVAQSSIDESSGSSYSYLPRGARALYLLLESKELEVRPLREPFSSLDSEETGSTMVVIGQHRFQSASELREWVSAGNKAVFLSPSKLTSLHADGFTPPAPTKTLPWILDPAKSISVTCAPGRTECQNVKRISQTAAHFAELPEGWEAVLSERDNKHVLVKTKIGDGELWIFADSAHATNQHIDRFDNLLLLYQLVAGSDRIIFDEFHHGYIEPTEQHLTMKRDAVVVLIGFIVFVLVLGGLSRSMRFGPPIETPFTEPSSSVEFATVVGLLYQERRLHSLLRHYLSAWKHRVETAFGIHSELPTARILEEMLQQQLITGETKKQLSASIEQIESETTSLSDHDAEALRITLESVFQQQVVGNL